MDHIRIQGISIQVSLSGYSFKIKEEGEPSSASGWNGPDKVFTAPELQGKYDDVEISLMTPKVSLVPSQFFDSANAWSLLSQTVAISDADAVGHVALPEYAAHLVYSLSVGESLSKAIAGMVSRNDGRPVEVLPEMYFILKDLQSVPDYNKIVASFADSHLHLAIAQGKNLLLANVFEAVDFTTAEYFIFMALKKLQLNPEVSSIYFRTPLADEEEMSLYRYFKGVERL